MTARRFFLLTWAMTAVGWIAFLSAGNVIARLGGDRLGPAILRIGQGKIQDPGSFIHARCPEMLWLLSAALILCATVRLADWFYLKRNKNGLGRWIAGTLVVFVSFNLWLRIAGETALFWGLMWSGNQNQNFTQFQFKRILLRENQSPRRAILLGSSQVRAQIDENQLNAGLGMKVWTTELHYPGSHSFDLLLAQRQLERKPGDIFICYLSEINFFAGSDSEGMRAFLRFRDLKSFCECGGPDIPHYRSFYYGLLGDAIPAFRFRDPLAQRFLGPRAMSIKQARHNTSLSINLAERAQAFADTFMAGPESAFEFKAFEKLIAECGHQNGVVILFEGQVNPLLGRRLNPAFRRTMKSFLKEMQLKYPFVTVIKEESIPPQPPETYADLTHVTEETQAVFTRFTADFLERIVAATPGNPLSGNGR